MKHLLAFVSLALASASQALTFDDVTNWTGTGGNRAAFVVDWNDGLGNDSLVWGYRWDGVATGEQMLRAIVDADPGLTASLGEFSGFGVYVNGFGYGVHQGASSGDSYWAYYNAESATAFPTSWSYANAGATTRSLSNGSWDGWSFGAYPNETAPSLATPAAPVPEPGTLLVLGLGAGLLRRRRK